MKQILIATHGKMASGIKFTAELILGNMAEITTIDAYINPEDDIEVQFREYFEAHKEERIFVMTDLMGGSVNQKLMAYAELDNVTLITGINLPVLMQIMMAEEEVSEEELEACIEDARQELQLVQMGKEKASEPQKKEAVQAEGKREQGENAEKAEKAENVEKAAAMAGAKTAKRPESLPQNFDDSTARISALRIDDRLIHGQVAMTWTKQLRVQGIVVANDDAANDNTQKMALKMAVPAGIKVLIKPVEEAIRILNYPKASEMRILVLTRTVKDALRVRRQVGEIEFLNLGNTGRFDGIDISKKRVITPTIMLSEPELEALRELAALDPAACMQQVPNDERKLISEVLENL